MKTFSLAGFAVILVYVALPFSQPAGARTGMQRCEDTDGSVVYTDRACGSLGVRATPMSGELLTRIARDEAANPSLGDDFSGDDDPPLSTVVGRRSPLAGCARTTTQLSMDIQGSLALHNVNRLAESYHWVGQSHSQAQQLMLRLERLTAQPLLDMHFFDAQIGPGGMRLADAGNGDGSGAGVMQLTLGQDSSPQVIDFDVLRYSGCYFLRF